MSSVSLFKNPVSLLSPEQVNAAAVIRDYYVHPNIGTSQVYVYVCVHVFFARSRARIFPLLSFRLPSVHGRGRPSRVSIPLPSAASSSSP